MKIGAKLNTLIAGIILAFVLVSLVFFVYIKQAGQIDAEKDVMDNLLSGYHTLLEKSMKLYLKNVDQALEEFEEAAERMDQLFEELSTLTVLPEMDNKIAESLVTIGELNQIQKPRIEKVVTTVEQTRVRFHEICGLEYNFVIADLPLNSFLKDKSNFDEMMSYRAQIETSIKTLSLEWSIQQVVAQSQIISNEIGIIRKKTANSAFLIIGITTILSLLAALIITRSICSRLIKMQQEVRNITTGNLSKDFSANGNDEISMVAADLNTFLLELKDVIGRIKKTSSDNARIKEVLISSVDESSSATRKIVANMDSIQNRFKTLENSISESVSSIGNIRQIINNEHIQIAEQISMVEETTASVTQMISSIQSVSHTTEKSKDASLKLVSSAKTGGIKLQETTKGITAINNDIETIQNMADLIQSISEQTNLLAMNAAIEAAHAGEFGKGFAVVAGEIRKLAEASARSSGEITLSLNTIVERISNADNAASGMTSSFSEIDGNVKNVEKAFTGIFNSMKELETGGNQILEAMQRLQEVSITVTDGSTQMNTSSDKVQNTIREVRRVSDESIAGISEMSVDTREINTAMEHLVTLSEEIQEVSQAMNEAVSFFVLNKIAEAK